MNILKHQLGMLHRWTAMSSYFSMVFRVHLRPLPSGIHLHTVQPTESKEIYRRCRQVSALMVSSNRASSNVYESQRYPLAQALILVGESLHKQQSQGLGGSPTLKSVIFSFGVKASWAVRPDAGWFTHTLSSCLLCGARQDYISFWEPVLGWLPWLELVNNLMTEPNPFN